MTANDAHCVEPKCQCVEGTMRIFAHWASHEQQKCKIANFHTLGISNKHVHKTGPCAPKTRICACALCAIGLRWHYRRWAQCPPTKNKQTINTAIVWGISNASILKCVVHQKVVDQNLKSPPFRNYGFIFSPNRCHIVRNDGWGLPHTGPSGGRVPCNPCIRQPCTWPAARSSSMNSCAALRLENKPSCVQPRNQPSARSTFRSTAHICGLLCLR